MYTIHRQIVRSLDTSNQEGLESLRLADQGNPPEDDKDFSIPFQWPVLCKQYLDVPTTPFDKKLLTESCW